MPLVSGQAGGSGGGGSSYTNANGGAGTVNTGSGGGGTRTTGTSGNGGSGVIILTMLDAKIFRNSYRFSNSCYRSYLKQF